MSSCLGLPLAAASGSEVLVQVPVRKAEAHCSLLGAFSTRFTALPSPRSVSWPSGHFSCDPHGSSVLQAA